MISSNRFEYHQADEDGTLGLHVCHVLHLLLKTNPMKSHVGYASSFLYEVSARTFHELSSE